MSTGPGNVKIIPPVVAKMSGPNGLPKDPPVNRPPPPPPPPRVATFTMDSLTISDTRSPHKDTDFVYLLATVGANPPVFVWKSLGDVNNGTHSVGLSLEVDIPDDDTQVVFSYLVLNNGNSDNDHRAEFIKSTMSTLAEVIIHHNYSTKEIIVGTIVIALAGSLLLAMAGFMELYAWLFANCDGPVAAGAIPFKCSDLINKTASGQKLPDITAHTGPDLSGICGKSHYSTTCTISTVPKIQTVLDLSGEWASGGVAGYYFSVAGNSFSIDMFASNRPTASGSILDSTHISVYFPDVKTYTAVLQAPNVIQWSNNSTWTKVPAIATVIDLNGKWMYGGVLGPIITVEGNHITVDMSAYNRPKAVGTVVSSTEISITFPDDKTYTCVLQKPDTISMPNKSTWTKFNTSVIKHLFVLVMENRSFDHLLGFQGITGKDTQTGVTTQAEDLTRGLVTHKPYCEFANLNYTVSPTAGDTTYGTSGNKHDVNHQFPDVFKQLTGQDLPNGGLNGGPYLPPLAKVAMSGFAADYAKSDSSNPGEPMRCFAPGAVPVLTALAKEFVLCDHWFSSIPGPTEPNRMFVHAATSGVWDDSPSDDKYTQIFEGKSVGDADDGISFENGTIFDALRRAKVPFRIYAGDHQPQVGLLSGISISSDIVDFENFAGDVSNPTYDAAYTFIEPRYDTILEKLGQPFVNNSQHPSNSVALGEGLIKSVYEAIRNSPLWDESMLIITWDEHGGFYDHVAPPRAARIPTGSPPKNIQGNKYGFMFDQYGVRVPAVVISPWCPQNMIEHRQLEHSFIPATIEQLFNLKPLTVRDSGVIGLETLASLDTPRNVTTSIPDPFTAKEPGGPLPGTPATPGGTTVLSSAASTPGKPSPAASVGAGAMVSPPTAPGGAPSNLDLSDPWLASALAVAIKAHIEAVPADAENIKARGFGIKTIEELAQYHKEITPIINNAKMLARQQKVAARKQPVSQISTFQTAVFKS